MRARSGFVRLADLSAAMATAASLLAVDGVRAQGTPEAAAAEFAFVDPALAAAWGVGPPAAPPGASPEREFAGRRHAFHGALASGLAHYRVTWGLLPEIQIPPGGELGAGDAGPRVEVLRERLAVFGRSGPYDVQLAGAVAAFQRAHGLEETGAADAATLAALNGGPLRYERLIEANLERAAALPPSLGERFILVDAAAGQLWFVDQGELRAAMKVVTGKPNQPTPTMAGMVRYLVFNPYWNVPQDLVQASIAPKVLERGFDYVRAEGLQVLSDYSDDAVELDPASVDWQGVAHGRVSVRVRQRPGPRNMMGEVKLMLPNPLGIYLHDTPLKGDFARPQRLASSGCVRLEDAISLATLLIGADVVQAALTVGSEEQRVDLEQPIPVYITYFTAVPTPAGFVFRPDVYGRDGAWLAQQERSPATARAAGP